MGFIEVVAASMFVGFVLGIVGYVAYVAFLVALATGERFQKRIARNRLRKEQSLSPYELALANIRRLEAELDFDLTKDTPT